MAKQVLIFDEDKYSKSINERKGGERLISWRKHLNCELQLKLKNEGKETFRKKSFTLKNFISVIKTQANKCRG